MPEPVRSCIACRQKLPQSGLIRIQMDGEEWRVNTPGAPGRSAYWCGLDKCLEELFRKNRISRTLRRPIPDGAFAALRLRLIDLKR